MSEILLVGGTGGIGNLLHKVILDDWGDDYECFQLSSKDMKVGNLDEVRAILRVRKPQVVVNLATISTDKTLHKLGECQTDLLNQLETNILGNINLVSEFASLSRERHYGRYIYISSILSERPVPGAGIYSACKAFNDNLIKTAALENGKYGVTFNSIQLGYFGAGLCEKLPDNVKLDVLSRIPTKRWGYIKELANLIRYFIDTEYANGCNIPLTGGLDI